MGKRKHHKLPDAKNELDLRIYSLIESGIGFCVVRINDAGEHVLQPFNEDKEYKFDSSGSLMNGQEGIC